MIPLDDVTKFLTVHQDADVLNGNYGQALSYIRMFFTEHIPAAMSSPRSTEKAMELTVCVLVVIHGMGKNATEMGEPPNSAWTLIFVQMGCWKLSDDCHSHAST
eukprot:TRINITY_DN1530_c0_g1_i5.p1 TRINITY_DN1530_c0_g1~~TRINITY_DN1530_c0_g1_i5.p1  ORF type:complete len:104 (-),score=2.57 TRINITY_DN1530_c0_g1_i5:6-317(-)